MGRRKKILIFFMEKDTSLLELVEPHSCFLPSETEEELGVTDCVEHFEELPLKEVDKVIEAEDP